MGRLCRLFQELGSIGCCDVFELQGVVMVRVDPSRELQVGMQQARLLVNADGACNGAKLGVGCNTKEGNFHTILFVLLCATKCALRQWWPMDVC